MMDVLHRLESRLDDAACAPRLLVACDFDGTLAELVDDPLTARPRAVASSAMSSLASMPNTLVAIVSGRALDDLRTVARDLVTTTDIRLFGSHGLEADDGTMIGMARGVSHDRDDLVRRLREIASDFAGARLEAKPYGAAIHYRTMAPPRAEALAQAVRSFLDDRPALFAKEGKAVIEVSVLPLYKPFAIDTLQHRWMPDVTIFAGDDQTDEDVFATLWPGDIGIKIGDGPTTAEYRANDPELLESLLCRLSERRRSMT